MSTMSPGGLWKNTDVLKAVAQLLKHRQYCPSLQEINTLHKSSLRNSIVNTKKGFHSEPE